MNKSIITRIVSVLLCVCCALTLAACGETKMSQSVVFAMDNVITVTAYGKQREKGIQAAESVIKSMDAMLDPQLSTSITYKINTAGGENVSIPGQVANMLKTAQTVYKQSGGALDLSLYPVAKRWGFEDQRFYVPTDEELVEDLALKCFGDMVLTDFPSSGSHAVSLPSYGKISFAAIGKGSAAHNATDAMRKAGVTSGIISMGGNVQTLGSKPDGTDWVVAVQDPSNTESFVGVISCKETAIVTSGGFLRNFSQNGKTYHHILNPDSGVPMNNTLLSVTIICPDGTLADALSTAMFVLGESKAIQYWRNYGGFEMVLINKDNEITCTKGLIEDFTLSNSSYTLRFTE